jgi:hypothetical protein
MLNLGKDRSKFGRFIDNHLGYGGQERVRELAKVSRPIITKVCSTNEYIPSGNTMKSLLSAVRKLTGKDVKADDFWSM